jgi:hypothetical protein
MNLPNRIFVTGAPGCKWTSVTHLLESIPGVNTSDRNVNRCYDHNVFQGHHGAYFGLPHRKYEFDCKLDAAYIDSAFESTAPGRFVKGHDWAYMLDGLKDLFAGDWLIMVQRDSIDCFAWWNNHGGYSVKYPSYESYGGNAGMMGEIMKLNEIYSDFAQKYDQRWEYFNTRWIQENFNHTVTDENLKVLNNLKTQDFLQFFQRVKVCLVKL